MALDVRIVAAIFLTFTPLIHSQEDRCSYMTAIPREPLPEDLPVIEWEGGWNQRPFIPAPHRDDLCMGQFHEAPNGGTQIIFIEENIADHILIAKLNYNGPQVPSIVVPIHSGSFSLLQPQIRQEGGEWGLYITQPQDFETPGMQSYLLSVRIEGEPTVPFVALQIVNMDDNDPMIMALTACSVPELGEPRLTECVYQVQDVDGEISTRFMEFTIDSDRADDVEIFYARGANIPGTWTMMTMTLGINSALNFETTALHIFQITAWDSHPNTHTATIMVQVENVPHRPPRWVNVFAVQQFDEKTEQTFTMRAIDGDTGINVPIHYRLRNTGTPSQAAAINDHVTLETIEGGMDGVIIHVDPMDRDYLEQEIFPFSVVAYKYNNESSYDETNVVFFLQDINDQIPEPFQDEYHIRISEETPQTLNIANFGFHDRDLGENAQYTVHLESVFPPNAASAFYIAPEVGYQRQTFIVGTTDHSLLDYEDDDFRHISLRVIATDMANPEFVGVAYLYIDLINWNDELPIFDESTKHVEFDETVGAGFLVATMRAHDRDIGDRVEHSLFGNAGTFLNIDRDTGEIFVAIDNAFDYHRQNELFIQIRADDTLMAPYHTSTAQLTISLLDINNTPPTIRMPRGSPSIEENVPANFEINRDIQGSDPDTTAHLVFEIDWSTSYATKQGRETDPKEFVGCVDIETLYPNEGSTGTALGRIFVKEIRPGVTIDFEMFEVLYISVIVRDLKTVLGEDYDESIYTITIIDMNDNAPQFSEGTLTQEFRVREMSDAGIVIGSVLATDIDGPLYNQVRYTIFPREDTPDDLVQINFNTGQISVRVSGAIDADTPPRENLYYTVVASDRCYAEDPADCPPDDTYFDTPGDITIAILDTNNKEPFTDSNNYDITVYIYEDAVTGDEVVTLSSLDLDRDEIYNTVSYQIHFAVNPRLTNFFAINLDTGLLSVALTTVETLDRDGPEPEHLIFVNLIDNFLFQGGGNRNQNSTSVLVVLLDVNDNAPQLPEAQELSWSLLENQVQGFRLQPHIYAPDIDEPGTDNSRVAYEILGLTAQNRDIEIPVLFNMITIQYLTGELEVAMPLRGYWGTYDIHIRAFDHGIPQQASEEVYELEIMPYNFEAPAFTFPSPGMMVRLSREAMMVNTPLVTVDNDILHRIEATDNDGLHAGEVTFSVPDTSESAAFFSVANDGENSGILILTQLFSEDIREFHVTIRATDGGTHPGPQSSEVTLHVAFVPTQGDPVFSNPTTTVALFEQTTAERFQLPLATDPKNHLCDENCYNIYYRIIDGNDNGHFAVEQDTNVLYLVTELDREEAATHTLTIAASNSLDPGAPLQGATLTVHVTVREANPRPHFDRELYTAGISTLDTISRELFTVHATHSEGAAVTYTIDMESMVLDQTLEVVRDSAFTLNLQTGVMTLSMQPTAAMQGMFEFDVVATDTAGETDRAEVKIFVISNLNRVFFIFMNTIQQVEAERDFIAQTFSVGFGMMCNIDQVVPATNSQGVAQDEITEVRAHFIRDNVPVTSDVIEEIRRDPQLLNSIQLTLSTRLLVLNDVVTEESPIVNSDDNLITVYVLAGLSAILAFLVIVLLITFIIRTRALNRRLEALSTNKYGSIDSGLNRAGLAAPNTNQYAVEGSNPIWNEVTKAPDFDALSDSGDSDLIGIEDMPQFRADYFPPGDADSLQNIINEMPRSNGAVSDHSNQFNFNSSPFSPEFSNNVNQFNNKR